MGDSGAAVGDGGAAAGSVRARLEARLVMLTKHRFLQPQVAELERSATMELSRGWGSTRGLY